MRKAILLFTIPVLLFACNAKKDRSDSQSKPVVTVSIIPQKTFVEKIAGSDFDINVLIPPGASPATYTILPSQLKSISRSLVWFRIGHIGFEYSWKDKIGQANKNMLIVDLSQGIDLIADMQEQHGDHIHIDGIDPHIWLSPELVKKMSLRIAEVLIELNPDKKDVYTENYRKFKQEIEQLDMDIKNALKEYKGKHFLTFHPSLGYYAREYGLFQHSLESEGKEPTPQHMASIVKLARQNNIRVIFIQEEFDSDHARVFAEEIDGNIIKVSPLSPDWAGNLLKLTNTIIDNL
ncbi:MAG: zinc ABC transporter substrate-binding protein [Prolixibacteraceae bacterium]|nr:zinc ABC transporter substrate-binding protein [Prolixibacteraceae bacterium]